MTATKEANTEIQSNGLAFMPRLRAIEGLEGRTELTRVGAAWRRAISEPETEENDRSAQVEEVDASQALQEFRTQHQRRRLGIVTFVLGCSIGILVAVAPHSRFFRAHFLHQPAASVAPAAAPVAAPPAAPIAPLGASTGLAMAPLDIDALMPQPTPPVVVATTQISTATPKHTHSAAPVAKSPAVHAKSHAPAEDEDAVKNARAADDLAAAQLNDSL